MKTLFILASAMMVLFLVAPNKVEGQKRTPKTLTKSSRPQATEAISWVKTNFPSGVDTITAHLAISSSGHIFVGTGNGIYRSVDDGTSWKPINNGLKPDSSGTLTVFALAIHSSGHIFAAVWDKIYLSTDNGDHWTQQIDFGVGNGAFVLAINSSGHIFAGGERIYRSADNGVTWIAKNKGLISEGDDINIVQSIAFNSKGDIFAGTFSGVYRSTDNGENWNQKFRDPSNNAFVLAISPNGSLFANSSSNARFNTGDEGLYRSTNNGDKWTRIKKNECDFIVFNSSGHIFIGTWGTTPGLYRSMDNGTSWTNISKGLNYRTDNRVSALAFSPSGIMFAVTPAGVFRSSPQV